ncbi:MAG: hypothetical protein ACJAS1_004498 [Oleiphilaceae bacterium]|jgi:hypothetical protein
MSVLFILILMLTFMHTLLTIYAVISEKKWYEQLIKKAENSLYCNELD